MSTAPIHCCPKSVSVSIVRTLHSPMVLCTCLIRRSMLTFSAPCAPSMETNRWIESNSLQTDCLPP